MAKITIPSLNKTITDIDEAKKYLASINIGYAIWKPEHDLEMSASNEEVLNAYATEIEALKASGGYVTADVIDVNPDTPGLDVMLNKFNKEHWHDEDEIRFIIEGTGVFYIHPKDGEITEIEVKAGDLLRVPAGTLHWFDLCKERRIRAIRLFQDMSGWTPHYTESGVDKGYMPLCFGLNYIPSQLQTL